MKASVRLEGEQAYCAARGDLVCGFVVQGAVVRSAAPLLASLILAERWDVALARLKRNGWVVTEVKGGLGDAGK